jgi:phospholipid/cholesterol/gamma-HCH transport system substrate-binding protein
MEEKVNFAAIGAFVLVLGAALIGFTLWLSSGKSYTTAYDTYLTYMNDSVAGLNLNSPVRYRGVEVGRVRKIALAPGNVEQVQLTLAIERGTPVKTDTVAVLQTQGLTGLAYVELSGGSRNAPPLQKQPGADYPVIKAGPSLMTRLDTAVSSVLANLNKTSENINELLDADNRRAVRQALADLGKLSHTLAARSSLIDSGLVDAAHTMKNTSQLTGELAQLAPRMRSSAEAFDRMAGQLGQAGANASQFTGETLPQVQQLVMQLRDLTASLQRVSDQLEQNPSVLLYGKQTAKRGPGE